MPGAVLRSQSNLCGILLLASLSCPSTTACPLNSHNHLFAFLTQGCLDLLLVRACCEAEGRDPGNVDQRLLQGELDASLGRQQSCWRGLPVFWIDNALNMSL
jgi:hypothetical protein